MVWQIVNKVDTEIAKKVPIWARSPFIEMEGLTSADRAKTLKPWVMNKVSMLIG